MSVAKSENGLYEDRDGTATGQSIREYSDMVRIAVWMFSIVGLGASVATAALAFARSADPRNTPPSLLWHILFGGEPASWAGPLSPTTGDGP